MPCWVPYSSDSQVFILLAMKDSDVVQKLKDGTNDSIEYGLDWCANFPCISCQSSPSLHSISENGSIALAQRAFRPTGGHLVTILSDLSGLPRTDVKTEVTLVYSVLGTEHPEDRALHTAWCKKSTVLFQQGSVKVRRCVDFCVRDACFMFANGYLSASRCRWTCMVLLVSFRGAWKYSRAGSTPPRSLSMLRQREHGWGLSNEQRRKIPDYETPAHLVDGRIPKTALYNENAQMFNDNYSEEHEVEN